MKVSLFSNVLHFHHIIFDINTLKIKLVSFYKTKNLIKSKKFETLNSYSQNVTLFLKLWQTGTMVCSIPKTTQNLKVYYMNSKHCLLSFILNTE